MTVIAPAKLNLALRIHGKREDGFHELETLMVPLKGLADRLEFKPAEAYALETVGAEVGPVEDNLVTKALQLFEQRTGTCCPYQITLEKRIPPGAGLGGGSSDAAAVLQTLNKLEEAGLGKEDLEEMAAQLGSDVPFFLREGACWCRGRGEILEETAVEELEVLLLKPAFGVDTVDAYQRWADSEELPYVLYESQEVAGLGMCNDLERAVFAKFPFLAEVKMWLLEQFEVRAALMSGSGATVFAVLEDAAAAGGLAERAMKELDPKFWWWLGRTG
ncbi:MAG: 4-(cytidine 5'-diphospho)-2-C-methyl-D-erythritol kinase [Roseibacillus sp.]|nr:4-(cytidine 5'-diphospho)-2-C-methyl-D-erythritol kinase [Roseibacillus sp.]